jgi:hypothetical protein
MVDYDRAILLNPMFDTLEVGTFHDVARAGSNGGQPCRQPRVAERLQNGCAGAAHGSSCTERADTPVYAASW